MTIGVLLVDDHAVLRSGLKALLEATPDIRVVGEAPDGRKAVEAALDLKPDVIVMDIAMPEMNGIDAARTLRDKGSSARIVMLSMHSSPEHVYRALDNGALGYLLKESAGAEVITAVRAAFAGHRYLSRMLSSAVLDGGASSHPSSPLERLSLRERQVMQMVVEGKSSADIAEVVHLSPKTVETYRSRLMKKLDVPDVPALVKLAVQHGLTPP